MEKIVVAMLCVAMLIMGYMLGLQTDTNAPKKANAKKLNEASDDELMLLFLAVGCELEKRGVAERVEKNPFDELKK